MLDEEGRIFTAHSTNPVPVVVHSPQKKIENLREGILADISPTILKLMDIPQPAEMTGKSLIKK